MNILLIEDNHYFAELLSDALSLQDYQIDVACNGQIGLEMAQSDRYDLLILDVCLPILDGICLCQQLRRQGQSTPILMLTAKARVEDKVQGLNAGADDYVVKPVDLEELEARIQALQRRRSSTANPPLLRWGDLSLNPETYEVLYQVSVLRLTRKEFKLLEAFLRRPQQVHTRSRLLEQVWEFEAALPGEETVKVHIKSLRFKLRSAGAPANLIETLYGIGYRLNSSYLGSKSQYLVS